MPVTAEDLAARFPVLWHMAWEGSWPSIQQHGLLSTSSLLDLFQVKGVHRRALESEHRPKSVEIVHAVHGRAIVRDQKPMSDAGLRRALGDGLTPEQWYESLNQRVFFWVSEERLMRMLKAKAYRALRQTVLEVDTRSLLSAHVERVSLSPINSGCTKPFPHPRGCDTFLPIALYPLADWLRKRGRNGEHVVEFAVSPSVPDIMEHLLSVKEYLEQRPVHTLWRRSRR